eukprot:CAMPEP_0172624438 /NCGR_PEP_ID=MMETSP1068-20121228/136557_1 /TAXON_ID=35684 /ORGANISM="Pseudopedinella elastica, Strain CCMP716" /LENGTH=57 /DNA_ID=CAMNT_0013433393 /DNA_START=431 /DNA_END=604 /DNA_ORIENTATION=+
MGSLRSAPAGALLATWARARAAWTQQIAPSTVDSRARPGDPSAQQLSPATDTALPRS